MSEIYIVILEDRHTDVQVFAYTNYDGAKKKADSIVKDYDYTDEEDFDYTYTDTFLFAAPLSCEGDHLSLNKITLEG